MSWTTTVFRCLTTSLLLSQLSSFCSAQQDKLEAQFQALAGEWHFGNYVKPKEAKEIEAAWQKTSYKFTGKDCKYEKGDNQKEYSISIEVFGDANLITFHDKKNHDDKFSMLYKIENGTLRFAYLLHGNVPDSIDKGIVVEFKKQETTSK